MKKKSGWGVDKSVCFDSVDLPERISILYTNGTPIYKNVYKK